MNPDCGFSKSSKPLSLFVRWVVLDGFDKHLGCFHLPLHQMQGHEAGAQPRAARAEESTAESSASRGKANSERELEELREQAAFLAQSAPLDKPSGKDP